MQLQTAILPVFAGMVHQGTSTPQAWYYSPRIRGDGPHPVSPNLLVIEFSPYSRGWSGWEREKFLALAILPVFAGMVRLPPLRS